MKNINNDYEGGIQYYILNTPIKFLDDFIEDEKIKEKIQFFDTPGLDSLLKEYTDINFPKLIKCINLFIYMNANNIIFQNESESAIRRMIEFIMETKGYFDFNSFIFVINSFNKLDIGDKSEKEKKLESFKTDIFKIIKKYKESNWNMYINKYSKIVDKKEDISCSYFSKEIFLNEQNKVKEFLNFKNFFSKLNDDNSQFKIDQKINKIKNYIKKNYLNKLSNKKDFSENGIQIIDEHRKELRNILNIKDNDFELDKKDLDNIIITYDFVKKNIINFYTYKDLLLKLKVKITNENIIHFLLIMFKMIQDLSKSLNLIENNIKKWKSNENNEISVDDKFSYIYQFYKEEIENAFTNTKKDIKDNFNKIIYGENKSDEINICIKNLLKYVEKKYNSFLKEMDKKEQRIENELSLDLSGDFIFYFDFEKLPKLSRTTSGVGGLIVIIYYGIYGYLGIPIETIFGTYVFSSALVGGLVGIATSIVFF